MVPANFPFANKIFTAPGCSELAVCVHEERHLSCWKMDDVERQAVFESGIVWLYCWGGQPPVFVTGISPFKEVVLKTPTETFKALEELQQWHAMQADRIAEILKQVPKDIGQYPARIEDKDGYERAKRVLAQGGLAPWIGLVDNHG